MRMLLSIPLVLATVTCLHAETVATVNGKPITDEQLEAEVQKMGKGAAGDPRARNAALDRLVAGQLLYQEALRQKLDKSPEFKAELERAKTAILAGQALNRHLRANGIPEAAIQARFQEYQERNAKEYLVRHILVPSEEKAREIAARITSMESFADEAAANSTDATTARPGGALGWVRYQSVLPEFGDTMLKMEPNTVSPPVKTRYGWHLIWLSETRPAATPLKLDEVRGEIVQQLGQEAIASYFAELRSKAKVVVNEPPRP